MLDLKSAIAANRFGLGAGPGTSAEIGGDPVGWLRAQLDGAEADSAGSDDASASAATLARLAELRLARQAAQRARAEAARSGRRSNDGATDTEPAPGIDAEALREYGRFVAREYRSQVGARYARAIATERPFVERLVHFWANHFAISADKQPVGALVGHYENEAIRPHVTGRFVDMLTAVESHPAMLLYLDNSASIGPESMAARVVRRRRGRELGLNENLAREILELHTLGVDGGYDQRDVTEFARVLTGWSIGGRAGLARLAGGAPGEFQFRALAHDPGDKRVLGTRYREDGVEEGRAVLADLARQPATARHLATKLARHFVADEPPPALIERLTATYLESDGTLLPVYGELVEAVESWAEPLAKFKTPHDYVISAYRAFGAPPESSERVIAFLTQLGQRPLTPGSPAGWPDTAAHWDGGDGLLKRVEWAGAVGRAIGDRLDANELMAAALGEVTSEHTAVAVARAESGAQALGLLLAAPEFQRR